MTRFRMTYAVTAVVLACMAMHTTVGAQQPQENISRSKVRVGIFDSRALAVAFYRSEAFLHQINDLRTKYEEAETAGDKKRVQELEFEGSALQELMHKQSFGTWPVDNILERLKGEIPEIAAKADVEVIVSKWNIVYNLSGTEFVDVTDRMVEPFNPDKDTLKTIKELQRQDPVPL